MRRLVPLLVAGIALVALLADALFLLDRSATVVVVSMVSTLLIAGSLFLMFGGREDDGPSLADRVEP
jgi:hypothetical protein